MGRRCCIAGCASTSRLPEHHGVTYHSFPLDATIRSIWIKNTRLSADRTITKSVLVCSRHFRRVDFQPQRSGKYLLKQRVFPTVFPWGRIDAAQIEVDVEALQSATVSTTPISTITSIAPSSNEDETKATVEATVAQIMAEAAELSAKSNEGNATPGDRNSAGNNASAVRFQRVTNFSPGVRLEAQDFDGIWHTARVVEVDNDDCEVLIKFEKTGKTKSAVDGSEEWIPMNSTRLRQKVSAKPIPVFELEEKCMARWTGPRKFPGTVKQILGNDVYEVLFDDGYVKNVRAVHMNKIPNPIATDVKTPLVESPSAVIDVKPNTSTTNSTDVIAPAIASPAQNATSTVSSPKAGSTKKRAAVIGRKDWPLLDMSKLDLASLNLPDIPRDGEWTCHWVNDQPIGREGFLVVGEHRKPTVIVEDWRLPPGWVKHMYQRSNVLGKWDVILVTPNNKRFRSKADLKVYLEEQGEVYNPDIYDFSIHRRRAKDINAYVFTPDYKPTQVVSKNKTPLVTPAPEPEEKVIATDSGNELTAEETKAALENSLASNLSFLETPVASYLPPMELMTSPTKMDSMDEDDKNIEKCNMPFTEKQDNGEDKIYVYIGSLKVQIIDNLFHCPEEDCEKYFRKENHLQIHIKHYHRYLENLLGDCPKMMELAEKRTIAPDTHEPQPKNQIPNQQFFAKLHQQDLQQSRAHRKKPELEIDMQQQQQQQQQSRGGRKKAETSIADIKVKMEDMQTNSFTLDYDSTSSNIKQATKTDMKDIKKELKTETPTKTTTDMLNETVTATTTIPPPLDTSTPTTMVKEEEKDANTSSAMKRMRFSPNKRFTASRKSNRQRTSRHYFTPNMTQLSSSVVSADKGHGDLEDTRHVTSTDKIPNTGIKMKKRKSTSYNRASYGLKNADSRSGSLTTFYGSGGDAETEGNQLSQYIKENGEVIKIVHMRQEEIINCLCQYGEEDGLMIQCELCLCWQHGACNGIEKESDVPDKYVCYICRNAPKARESMHLKHDQDWLYEGKLPTANYHAANPDLPNRFEFLKKSHTLTGNLLDLKRVMYSLRVKINIANNRCHPKLYLWAKNWDEDEDVDNEDEDEENDTNNNSNDGEGDEDDDGNGDNDDVEGKDNVMDDNETSAADGEGEQTTNAKEVVESMQLDDGATATTTTTNSTTLTDIPNIPQPEAPIDPEECQERLINHIKIQQSMVNKRLDEIALEIDELESQDELEDLKDGDIKTIKETLATFIRELNTLKQLAKLNALENAKRSPAVNA